MRALIVTAGLLMFVAGMAANAQNSLPYKALLKSEHKAHLIRAQATPTATPPAGAPAFQMTYAGRSLEPGMVVKDSSGTLIGAISQVGRASDGSPMAVVDIDGNHVLVSQAVLQPVGTANEVVSQQTKAQLLSGSLQVH